jgi:hypothetical protein
VQEHRRFRVPVRLGADVDPADDHVDLAAALGELDDAAERARSQSMFSVPLAIEIFAPAETANQSTGTPMRSARSSAATIRRHSGSATEPISRPGSPNRTTRAIPSG